MKQVLIVVDMQNDFVSGALGESLRGRLSLATEQGGAWQSNRATGEKHVLKREPPRVSPWRYLGINRTADTFAALVSEDGRTWAPFMTCTLPLTEANTVGFVVSPNLAHALSTAKFTTIRLTGKTVP